MLGQEEAEFSMKEGPLLSITLLLLLLVKLLQAASTELRLDAVRLRLR